MDLAVFYLGALRAGVIVVPLADGFGRSELQSIVAAAAPRCLIVDEVERRSGYAEVTGLRTVSLGSLTRTSGVAADGPADRGRPAAVHFTAGSTGTPRGVVHTVEHFVANARRFAAATDLTPDNRFHLMFPMTHLSGYYNLLLLPLAIGASVVVDRPFGAATATRYWAIPREHGVNTLWFAPTVMAVLLRTALSTVGRRYCRESVSFAAVGMAPLDAGLRASFEHEFGITVHNNYGLAETLFLTSSRPSATAKGDAVGTELDGVRLELRQDEEQSGERIVATTGDLMLGYLMASRTGSFEIEPPESGGFDTGDLGGREADGTLRIKGRAKDLIIRGGMNLSPRAIERPLRAVSGVREVVAVGLADPVAGERVIAAVECEPGVSITDLEPALRAAAGVELSQPQRPALFVQIDELPRSPAGKVRRALLTRMVEQQIGGASAGASDRSEHLAVRRDLPQSGIRALFDRAAALELEGEPVFHAEVGRPEFRTPDAAERVAVEAIAHGHTQYIANRGLAELRSAVAADLKARSGREFDPEKELVVTVGASEAVAACALAFLAPGDDVIIPEPAWNHYRAVAQLAGANAVSVATDPVKSFGIDPEAVEAALTPRTRMIVLNSPGNPTGAVQSAAVVREIARLAAEHGILLLLDAVYEDFVYEDTPRSLLTDTLPGTPFLFVNSFSKSFAMTGWRIGYLAASAELADAVNRIHQYLTVCGSPFSQAAAAALLRSSDRSAHFDHMRTEFAARREAWLAALADCDAVRLTRPNGAFYLFPQVRGMSGDELSRRLLNEKRVATVPGAVFGPAYGDFIRISYGAALEVQVEAARRVRALLEAT